MTDLTVEGLDKSFGDNAVLNGVSLHVPAGTITAVLGPSGSGKTTLLRVIAGFERADAGTVSLGTRIVDDAHHFVGPHQRGIGYVPQEGALFPHLNVEKNIGFGLARGAERARRVGRLMKMLGLVDMGRRYPHELSGGQQQRVALARALAVSPTVVLLDEPFSSLDASLRASVRADVRRVLEHLGATAVLVTHDQDEALSLADHVAIISEGRISQNDTPQRIYTTPKDPALARFLGEANMVPGTVEGTWAVTALGELELSEPASAPGAVTVLVRPEQIELLADPAEGAMQGEVVDYEYFGHDAVIRVRPSDQLSGLLVARVTGGRAWERSTRVGIRARGPVLCWPAGEAPAAGEIVTR